MDYNLENKVALVTGGSRGLGAAICRALGNSGAKVAVNYFSRMEEAKSVQEEIVQGGGIAEIFQGDVTKEVEVKKLCESVTTCFGPIDILVLNATLIHVHKPIEDLVWQDMVDHFEFFVKSPLLLAQQVLPSMKQRKQGRIINIGSEVFERGIPRFSHYVAAKGAQLGLTRSWANELGEYQITVNLVAPGWIPTEMHDNDPEEMKLDYAENVPLKRMGAPSDIGEMVAFLASDAAKFITGQRMTVNGGNTMV
ncbi:SDR family oxidoreductase [Chryseolinea sp. H1M3-3]|uniref:SDR family NAD(P)-dependent oxidoreductase n=1 Tax=Chryseolinea sp. H1M3-3 TaxID=3034144 RepID=UPI0023EBD2CF|nr:SDR family oxidoreductase [Chryseolinea sp. H1M3-3]